MAIPQYTKKYSEENETPKLRIYRREEENESLDKTPVAVVEKECKKSEVYPYTLEDAKKMITYFQNREEWIHYLMFALSYNMARRVSDMLSMRWKNFFNPATGEFRDNILEIREKKTKKYANPRINAACREAINLYVEKNKAHGLDVSANNYENFVFLQLSGTHPGKVITRGGCLTAIKRAAEDCKISYNVGTHSARKSFGANAMMLHPADPTNLETVQVMLNHSDSKTTTNYIGLTKQKVDAYYDDAGTFFEDYITGDKKLETSKSPIVSIDSNVLREIISMAYQEGMRNAASENAMDHINTINTIMEMVEEARK